MPYYAKSEDWLHHSSLLLDARPETTIVTTRYHIKPARRRTKAEKEAAKAADAPAPVAEAAPEKPPRGHLVLKTYDPVSGVTLKYKTSKAAEVGRLVQMLGGLGRRMAALPPAEEAVVTEGGAEAMTGVEASGSGTQTPVPAAAAAGAPGNAGGGGKGKKKKGKR
ncbi:signal recognition particle 9 kDa protein-domain-containing protein [Cercophora newfieldiana]|uniref:Signal recognition particle 9 kDa protein-domain-containing protein n=1 Tax=Cercophora newfieldiana TaxID=92897 RepID=A0AA39Y4Y4_9PEZI|nr:signal recognition particle 9 kDa protein-domain-containing protein [Cercophora newfieldiana]